MLQISLQNGVYYVVRVATCVNGSVKVLRVPIHRGFKSSEPPAHIPPSSLSTDGSTKAEIFLESCSGFSLQRSDNLLDAGPSQILLDSWAV
jgi:hypothetical protein